MSSGIKILAIVLGVSLGAFAARACYAPTFAQQPVTVANTATDPCADPTKVITVSVFTLDAVSRDQEKAADGSERIYLCNARIQGSAAGSLSFYFGSDTECATSETLIDRVTFTTAEEPTYIDAGTALNATFARSAAGAAFCTERHDSMVITGYYRYVQE